MRRLLLIAATALLTLVAVELVAWVGLRVVSGRFLLHGELQAERDARVAGALGDGDAAEIEARQGRGVERALHPYLGWVKDADAPLSRMIASHPEARDHGFPDNEGPIFFAPDPKRLVVAVLGGSVANDFAHKAGPHLLERMAELPRFAGRELVLVSLALPGYKQPQQLMALSWFLALGAHFDLVLALDGYNELIASAHNALGAGVHPAYPKRWLERAGPLEGPLRLAIGEAAFLQQRRADRARAFSVAPLRWSLAAGLVWRRLDRRLESQLVAAQTRAAQKAEAPGYQVRGPRPGGLDEASLFDDVAALWARSSLQMHQLAVARGAEFRHFLQPNQYVAGSKPFSDEERARAIRPGGDRARWVGEGYPRLQREGERLREQGVAFHDLTGVYAGVEETVYSDACCHVNRRGNRLLAEAIVRTLADDPGGV